VVGGISLQVGNSIVHDLHGIRNCLADTFLQESSADHRQAQDRCAYFAIIMPQQWHGLATAPSMGYTILYLPVGIMKRGKAGPAIHSVRKQLPPAFLRDAR
jgi:hypothetical protein